MKRNLTPEDMAMFTEAQQQKIRDAWRPQAGDLVACKWLLPPEPALVIYHVRDDGTFMAETRDAAENGGEKPDYLPLLSLAQCVELALAHTFKGAVLVTRCGGEVYNDSKALYFRAPDWKADEPIDALRDALREVL